QGKGTLEYINTTNSTATSVKFDEIETLTGGSAADTFDVATKVDMSLNGGEGKDSITLPKEIDDITLAVGSGVPSVGSLTLSNFEKVQADASIKGTLRAFDGEATWVISNENIGTLTLSKDSQTSVTEFGNFNKLVSGNGVDHFIFGDNGSVTTIQADSLDDLEARNRATHWELTSTLKLTDTASTKVYADSISGLNKWQGGKEADNFNLSAFAGDLIDLTIDGGGGQNQFTSPAGTWSWTLTDSQKGELTAAAQKIRFAKINTLVGGANQTLTNSANVDGWKVSQTNLLTADIGGLATQLKDFGTVNTGNSGDVLVIDAAYTGAINLQGGANSVNLGAAGSITTLSAGGAQDTITSALTKSIWTLTENTDKRFITVKATAESANPIINELFGFESIFVTTTNNTLASTLNDNKWTIAAANTGLLNNIKFSGFDQLIGSDGKDTFSFTTGDAFVGTIDGKLGDNLVDVSTGGQTKFELKAAEGVEFKGVKGATGVTGAGATAQLNLVSDNKASWTISDENSGELIYSRIVNDVQVDTKISFAGFGILVGGTGNDVFSFSSNGKLSSIDGGAGSGSDSLMAKPNQSNQWSLAVGSTPNNTLANFNNGMAGPMYLADFDGIETIVGAGQDRLLVESGTTRWSLTKNAGTLINSPLVAGAADLALKFSGFKTLWGSDAKDTYNLVEVPEFADIDGRGGENLVQLAAQDAVLDLTQGFAVQGVKNVTGVSGSGANASLTLVANSNATWTLTDKNAGAIKVTISGQEKSIAFDNFINLTGGSNNDAFILDAKGYVTGAINGGGTSNGGQNSLTAWSGENANWILNSNSSVAASTSGFKQSFSGITLLNGSEKVDTFDVQSAQTLSINAGLGDDTLILRSNGRLNGQFDGGQNVNTVQTIDGANSWQLTSATSGSVLVSGETTSRASFSQVSRLIGGSGLDNLIGFNTAATWEVGATSGIIVTGTQGADKTNFSKMDVLTGGEQSDVFKVSGAFAGDIFGKGGSDTLELLSNGSVLNFTGGTQGADATGDKIIGPVAGAVWQFNTDKNTLTDKNGTPLLGNFQEVETLQADTTGEDTLVSTLVDNSWNLSSANAGLFNGAINFNGFDYLTGSDLKDSFVFNFVGTFGKGVDAGKGDNSVQLNLVNRVELDWADKIVNGVKGANIIIGSNSVESELSLQSSVGLTWIIDRLDGGVISDGTSSFKFDQYKNLKGSLASDDFRFTNAGAISTSIDGGNGDGIDSLTGLVGDNTWQLGQTFAITGQSGTYVKNAAGFERLLGNLNKDTFNVNTRVKASITGGDGDDRLVLAAGSQLEGSFNGNLGDNTVESQLAASRWELSSVVTGVISNGDETALRFSNANKMQALASGDNQLSFAGLTADLQWLINSGSNERAGGQVAVTGQLAPATQFSGFNRITGAKGADDMTLAAAVSEINLGEGNNRLTLQTGAKVNSLLAGTGRDE
ncbi:MAG TPA: hypothetical protein PK129_04200, partial [Cellvibrionaceae bacterium]|nr:hypothetical protein [Cellvibrionaceae bacterium]